MTENFNHFIPGSDVEPFAPRPLRVPASRITRLRASLEMSLMANAVLIAALVAIGALVVAVMRDNTVLHLQVAHLHDKLVLLQR